MWAATLILENSMPNWHGKTSCMRERSDHFLNSLPSTLSFIWQAFGYNWHEAFEMQWCTNQIPNKDNYHITSDCNNSLWHCTIHRWQNWDTRAYHKQKPPSPSWPIMRDVLFGILRSSSTGPMLPKLGITYCSDISLWTQKRKNPSRVSMDI